MNEIYNPGAMGGTFTTSLPDWVSNRIWSNGQQIFEQCSIWYSNNSLRIAALLARCADIILRFVGTDALGLKIPFHQDGRDIKGGGDTARTAVYEDQGNTRKKRKRTASGTTR
jgi:hypothetical protein